MKGLSSLDQQLGMVDQFFPSSARLHQGKHKAGGGGGPSLGSRILWETAGETGVGEIRHEHAH